MTIAPWIQTATGKSFDLDNPKEEDVHVLDIAHSLAGTNRYSGHTCYVKRPKYNFWTPDYYSVAQHSCLCADMAPEPFKFEALMHDAHEAYVGDISSPLKVLTPYFRAVENNVAAVVRKKFLLPPVTSREVKHVDERALVTEKRDIMVPCKRPWQIPNVTPFDERIKPWSVRKAKAEFVERFYDLWRVHYSRYHEAKILRLVDRAKKLRG